MCEMVCVHEYKLVYIWAHIYVWVGIHICVCMCVHGSSKLISGILPLSLPFVY